MPRLGLLIPGSASAFASRLEAFRQGLHDLGYLEGQNIAIAYRFADGKADRLPALAAELVHLKVDVMVIDGTTAIRAAKHTTTTIPIVMAASGDPVGTGCVASLARPGGNITGLSFQSDELSGKWLELLKEAVPQIARVAVLWQPDAPGRSTFPFQETQRVARALGLQLQSLRRTTKERCQRVGGTPPVAHGALLAEPRRAGDALQPPLLRRCGFQARLTPGVRHQPCVGGAVTAPE